MLHLERYAYHNSLSGVHPGEKFLFSMSTLICCLMANSLLVSSLVIVIMTLAAVCKASVPLTYYFKLLLFPAAFLLLGTITIAVTFVPAPSDLLLGVTLSSSNFGITTESLTTAAALLTRALASVTCLYFLSLTTPFAEIISVLRKLKCPELLLELMCLTYRYIFVLLDTAAKIYTSQAARLGYWGLTKTYSSLGCLAASLFIRSYRRSLDLYISLEARCYQGRLEVLERDYSISKKNLVIIAINQMLLISLALLDGGII